MGYWFLAVSVASLVVGILNLVGLWLVWCRLTRRFDEMENLINQYGGIVGAYLDAVNDKEK